MRRGAIALAVTVLAAACRTSLPSTSALGAGPAHQRQKPLEKESVAEPRESDSMLDTGLVLRPHEGVGWGAHLMLPVSIGWTDFDLMNGIALDGLATIAVVPTVEFIIPVDERWTLLPFVGVGAAWQIGDNDLIGDNDVIALTTAGLRATRWEHFAERHWFGIKSEVRYDAALTGGDGLLGDWGSLDFGFELRRDFGAPREGPRFQGGIYAQGFWFWDPIQLEIPGVSPTIADNYVEIGISLGSTSPTKLLGIELPRVFIGYLAGDGLSGVRIRFGRL